MTHPTAAALIPVWLGPTHLQGMLRGIERESLRMQSNGFLSQHRHPEALGAALTHPFITTDYSEALMEFITPPQDSIAKSLNFLEDIHRFTAQHLPAGESLWPLSMPCMLDAKEENIPLAQYGSSNLGQFKTLYRHGLGVRYGRRMQTIAGVHYNLSFPEHFFAALQHHDADSTLQLLDQRQYRSHRYFGLIRNFIRLIPMIMYLLGASPTVCRCFVTGRQHSLKPLIAGTLHLPNATALRMGRLGYQNSAQRQLGIHYNHLHAYLEGMAKALSTPYPAFSALGLDDDQDQPIQINDHVLQIENEYYSLIRPKQTPLPQESPSQALASRGIGYVELRAVDVDPYSPIGISSTSAAFLELLALYCLLDDSPEIDEHEQNRLDYNQALTVEQGRDPELEILIDSGKQRLSTWIAEHLNRMQPLAELLDQAHATQLYQDAWAQMQARCQDVHATPSYHVLADTTRSGGTWNFGASLAKQHQQHYLQHPLSHELQQYFVEVAQKSREQQRLLEAQPQPRFYDYIQPYRNLVEN
jgi:glutamate--cysteine ligase